MDIFDKLKAKREIDKLIKAVKNSDDEAYHKAVYSLSHIGETAIEPLIQGLKEKYEYVYRIETIGDIEDSGFEVKVREGLAKALIEIGEPAIEQLIYVLKDGKSDVREGAAFALGCCDPSKIDVKKIVEPLIRALKDEDRDVRKTATNGLGFIRDSRAIEPLIQALGDKSSRVRLAAAAALGRIKDERAVEPLIQVLNDEDSGVRQFAIMSLEEIGDQKAIEPLSHVSLNDEDEDLRHWASGSLVSIAVASRTIEPLIQLLKTGDKDARFEAAIGLGNLGGKGAVEPLIQALGDKSSKVRWRAALSLGELGDRRAVEPLTRALKDKNGDVQKYAAEALGMIGETKLSMIALEKQLRSEEHNVRISAAQNLAKIGIEAVPILVKTLKDDRKDVFDDAAWGIQTPLMDNRDEMDEEKLHEALIPAIQYLIDIVDRTKISKGASSYDKYVARAIGTLGAIGNPGALPALKKLLAKVQNKIGREGVVREYVNTGIAAGYISTKDDIYNIEIAINAIKEREKKKL